MADNEISGIKLLLNAAKSLIKPAALGFKLGFKFFDTNFNLFLTDEIEKKNEKYIIASLIFLLCLPTILMGIVITILLGTAFPSLWEFSLIYTAVLQSPVAVLLSPFLLLTIYLSLELLVAFFFAKKIVEEISVDFRSVFIFGVLSIFAAIFYGTLSMFIGELCSHIVIISPKPTLLQGSFTVVTSVFCDLLFIIFGAIKYFGFIRRKIKTELGLKDEVVLKLFSSSSKIYPIAFYLFVVTGNQFSAEALHHFSSKALTEENRRMLDAKKNPIIITTNFCVLRNDEVVCAMTVIPQRYQDYTLYANWDGRVEKSIDNQGLIPIVVSTRWKPTTNQNTIIPTIHLESNKLMDFELSASKNEACKLDSSSVANETAIFFQVSGRSDEYNLPRPLEVRMKPNNEEAFRNMLKTICNI
ncbi:hypothetical protein H8K32_14470 [Undibacterium jejuense]|uniref:Uncharacterized protein n=1 Tax=Undibacterium jejuense TaxID=1344949 RepID=A0A923KPY1_9BURK|nr:hypothetical protein [Undibacterium jejuense]MBC3863308.1 hypothetical protein [Undibacterium jejuense]